MQKLLIPFDGSDNAARALDYALRLAKRTPTQLHVVTVHPESVVYGEIQVYVSKEKMDELQRKHCEDILQSALDAARAAGVPVTSEILTGDTAAAIVARAEALGCDSIVMGTRGMGAVGNLVMGSVATKVVHLTKLPVTLVK
ncbi:MAG: universal stress protein [Pseudorhodoplanes sp.]|nr:MAG: universal stress protein [Pseudorhodoplanes sp.]MBZ0140020.1 universal stress protein [Pseudorhodoplanes sp.]